MAIFLIEISKVNYRGNTFKNCEKSETPMVETVNTFWFCYSWIQRFPRHSESCSIVAFICFEMQIGILSTRSNCCGTTRVSATPRFKKTGISVDPVVNFKEIFGTIRVRFDIQKVYSYLNNTPSICGQSPIIIFQIAIVTWIIWTSDDPLNTRLVKPFH